MVRFGLNNHYRNQIAGTGIVGDVVVREGAGHFGFVSNPPYRTEVATANSVPY